MGSVQCYGLIIRMITPHLACHLDLLEVKNDLDCMFTSYEEIAKMTATN